MTSLEGTENLGRPRIGVTALNLFAEDLLPLQSEIEAVSGDRMHAHSCVADQRETRGLETMRKHGLQRIGTACTLKAHRAKTALGPARDITIKGRFVQRLECRDVGRIERQNERRQMTRLIVVGDRQERNRLPFVEPLQRDTLMGLGVPHPAYHDLLAEIMDDGADTASLSYTGKPPIGRDQKRRLDKRPIIKQQDSLVAIARARHNALPRKDRDRRLLADSLMQSGTDQMVRNKKAKRVGRVWGAVKSSAPEPLDDGSSPLSI